MFGDCKYRSPQIPYLDLKGHFQVGKGSIGATTIGTGGNWSPISQQVVTRMQGLHLSCQKFSGDSLPHPTPSPVFGQGVWAQTLVPLDFSTVAPLKGRGKGKEWREKEKKERGRRDGKNNPHRRKFLVTALVRANGTHATSDLLRNRH